MRTRFRIVLPLAVAAISIPLIVWDIHNEYVVVSMGMAWDTGAPLWPYQTPDIALRLLSFPAYIIAMPIANWLGLWLHIGASYFATGPLILGWWWLLGFWLDRELVGELRNRRWLVFSLLVVIGLMLLSVAVTACLDTYRWWLRYGSNLGSVSTALILIRSLTPAVHAIAIGILLAAAAK